MGNAGETQMGREEGSEERMHIEVATPVATGKRNCPNLS